jgi:hypothetical protein
MTPVSFDTTQDTVNVLQNRIAKKKELIGKIVTAFNKTFYISPSEVAFMHGGRIYYLNEEGRVYNESGEIVAGARVQYAYSVKDLTSVSILASKYEADTSLVVNFYVYDTGSGSIIEAKEKDISYEVIKSITEYIDELGCVRTTLYVSIVLPEDSTLQAYNIITDNTAAIKVYHNDALPIDKNTIAEFVKYDTKGLKESSYYTLTTTAIDRSAVTTFTGDTTILVYDGTSYVYNGHKNNDNLRKKQGNKRTRSSCIK